MDAGYSDQSTDTCDVTDLGVPPAPDYILRMIKCSCGNCGSARCSCVSSALPCTVFCRCDGSNVMLPLKCQIQMMIRKMTNKGITMLDYVNIFIILRVIAIHLN